MVPKRSSAYPRAPADSPRVWFYMYIDPTTAVLMAFVCAFNYVSAFVQVTTEAPFTGEIEDGIFSEIYTFGGRCGWKPNEIG